MTPLVEKETSFVPRRNLQVSFSGTFLAFFFPLALADEPSVGGTSRGGNTSVSVEV